ncbi:sigma-70 family RNA polymerase sigma factor family protein [Nocardiopsis lambiniae]|uniref:Uncharacterized protein n=1 Tax=Nocardiopsis lambiniae TaxID=3075539 RepID=A0ABU2M5I1_9ACTN|nr:hypothetical protein [Nocardiopsis sp. DSM 44743]MDT0327887.1 hypothetical protein [Nocardiopsis sp. DSM 44743]
MFHPRPLGCGHRVPDGGVVALRATGQGRDRPDTLDGGVDALTGAQLGGHVAQVFGAGREPRPAAVPHPDVVPRSDGGAARGRHTRRWEGARTVAEQAVVFGRFAPFVRPVLVNGAEGVLVVAGGRPLAVMGFTVTAGRGIAVDVLADPDRPACPELPGEG